VWPAVAAALLALQSPLFFAVARRNLMDAPLTACFALAAWLLIADEKRARPVALGIVCGAAILIKSIAGLLVLAMVLAVLLVRRQRVALLLAVTAGVAAPWFVFQAAVHPHWLWRELVLSEILGFGTAAPVQTSQENHLLFYVRRLFFTDPILPVMALMGSLRGRPPLVIAIWLGMVVAGLLAFSYRNATYLVPAIPAAAILALRTPQLYRQGALAAALLCGTFVLRAAAPGEPAWGLAYGPHRIASLAGLERYGAEHPGGELFLVSPDEDFAATLIPGIRRVRYVYLAQPPAAGPPPPLDFRGLGIIVTVDEFLNLDRHIGRFRARLRKADFTADDPIGTVVLAPSTADLERLIAASPGRDFSLPRSLGLQSAHHELSIAGHRVFFTARRP
jgi:hypothetical protein